MKEGKNAIAAVVWDMGNDAPNAQFSHRAGFILDGATEAEEFVATPKTGKSNVLELIPPRSREVLEALSTDTASPVEQTW